MSSILKKKVTRKKFLKLSLAIFATAIIGSKLNILNRNEKHNRGYGNSPYGG